MQRAIDRIDRLELCGLHAHIGSQVFDLGPYEKLAEVLTSMGDYPLLNLGGGLGVAYTDDQQPLAIEDYVDTLMRGAPEGVTVLCEPGRSLVANAGVTLYTVETVKPGLAGETIVAVDGGMSDNLRPMLYGAAYSAALAARMDSDGGVSTVVGKQGANIVDLKIGRRTPEIYELLLDVEVDGLDQLVRVQAALRATACVTSVERNLG